MDITQTSDSSQYGVVENSPYRIPHDRHTEDVNLGASWYFSRKEIEENSLSRRDGIDLKKESYLRKSYCTYLQELGVRLKVPPVTIATAVVFCHRFFLRQSHARNDRMTIATVCMFLAGKVEETPRPLKDVILISYEVIHKKDPVAVARIKQKEVYEKQKELLLIGERVVLVTLDFELNVHHPYKPLVQAIEKFNKVAQKALAQAAWSFVNDGLRTSLCLQFKPQHIAAGAIFLATKFLKVKLPADGENFWLQQFDVTPRLLEEVSNQMLELYGPAPGQDAKGSPASVTAPEKGPGTAKEHPAHENHQASRQSNTPSCHGYDDPPPEKQNSNQRIPPNKSRGGTANGNEAPNILLSARVAMKKIESRGGTANGNEARNISLSTTVAMKKIESRGGTANGNEAPNISLSTTVAMKKIDRDKVKAELEEWGNSKGDSGKKIDVVDDDDLIERELEHVVESAAEDEHKKLERRQILPNPQRGDHQNTTCTKESTEEGALSVDSQERHSPELDSRKRKDMQEHMSYDCRERNLKRRRE